VSDRYECPEWGCIETYREDELIAHLEWDHRFGPLESEREVRQVVEDAGEGST